jgi:hypothetical protein
MKDARILICHRCQQDVPICHDCDYGQIYCRDCAHLTRLESQRAANRRYQETRQGKFKHAEREKRYRKRQKDNHLQKNVTYHPYHFQTIESSSALEASIEQQSLENSTKLSFHHCHFCRCEVSVVARVDFLQQHTKKMAFDAFYARDL